MGGLSKKGFELEKRRKDKARILTVDAGALLFKHDKPLAPGRKIQDEIQAKGIVAAYNLLNYDAVGISAYDLAAGLDFFQEIAARSKFPWLSANLVEKSSGLPLFTPWVIVEKQQMKIGIIALTGSRAATMLSDSKGKLVDWHRILTNLVGELQPKCDLLILLSNLSIVENREICRDFPGINLVVQAGIHTGNMNPVLQNKTLLCHVDRQGKYLGEVSIRWAKKYSWGQDYRIKLLNRKRSLDRINWQLKRLENRGDPAQVDKHKPGTLQKYKFLKARQRELQNEITVINEKRRANPQNSTWKNQFIAMKVSLADQADVLKIVNDTKQQVNEAGKSQARGIKMMKSYIGSQACGKCHAEQYANWGKSRHGRAFHTLEEKGQQYNLNCLYCHVTGLNQDNAVLGLSLDKNLHNVGCESCHGPGNKHQNEPENQQIILKPSARTCLACHHDEHDDSFIYEKAVADLNCR